MSESTTPMEHSKMEVMAVPKTTAYTISAADLRQASIIRAPIRIKRLSENAKIPTLGSIESAGADLYAAEDVTIPAHATMKVSTGIAIQPPASMFVAIFARSGLATKEGLRPSNCVGVVDSDYRGAVIVALHNDSEFTRFVHVGDRIAQMVCLPYYRPEFTEVEELEETDRGEGGFGSTGKN